MDRMSSRVLLFLVVFGVGRAATFYQDVAPILRKHCLGCHAPGEIAPMPLVSYKDVKPWSSALLKAVKSRHMPPWFADPQYGVFANDARLTDGEIQSIEDWVDSGAPEGKPPELERGSAPARRSPFSADLVVRAPSSIAVPADAVLEYQYIILPLPFTFDRWVRAAEIRPSDRSVVHHAVLYVREAGSQWLRDVKPGIWYAPSSEDAEEFARSRDTKQDILALYTPGTQAMVCPEGMAKKIPAGADLVLQLHYTSKKTPAEDQPQVGLAFAKEPPKKRILTLQMGRDDLRIPPGDANYRASVSGTVPNDALLISMLPHMHLRGAAFDFELLGAKGQSEFLLRVKNYHFHWQLNYILATPRLLPKGSVLRWTGYFDNSANNHHNPDPTAEVTWGEQSWDEMMIGFFDVAVEPNVDKQSYFKR